MSVQERAGFDASRLEIPRDRARRIQRSEEMLCRSLNLGTTVAVVGSGCSLALGYPGWSSLVGGILQGSIAALESEGGDAMSGDVALLKSYAEKLASGKNQGADDFTFYLGGCQRVVARLAEKKKPFYGFIHEEYGIRECDREVEYNPFKALLALPISRFITTNYDCEIEQHLHIRHGISPREFGLDGRPRRDEERTSELSFCQKIEDCEPLTRFVLATRHEKPMVFHCHGRFDQGDTIIATEADYQRWYLGDRNGFGSHFRQAIELLFGSNPLLFVGYGMKDEDLLKPLRFLGAADPERKSSRPLFALLGEEVEAKDWICHQQLFERFGVNVIPFTFASKVPKKMSLALSRALLRLGKMRHRRRDEYLEKPFIRRVILPNRPPDIYQHYVLENGDETKQEVVLAERQVEQMLKKLLAMVRRHQRVICITGPGGTGKTWHAIRLMHKVKKESSEFKGFFFWSSYYADDSLTGLDRVLAYLDPKSNKRGSRLHRFRQCLADGPYLLVFDGFERLLVERGEPGVGKPPRKASEEFLKMISSPDNRGTVIITSRLWPETLTGAEKVSLQPLRAEHLQNLALFRPFSNYISPLCSLLDGHTYALLLAGHYLNQQLAGAGRGSGVDDPVRALKRELAAAHPGRRINQLLKMVLGSMDRRWQGMAYPFLERIAVFMSPLNSTTVEICFRLACESLKINRADTTKLNALLKDLRDSHILFKMSTFQGDSSRSAYTVHPTVRSFLFHQSSRVTTDILPNFTLPGFTSGTAVVHPVSRESSKMVKALFKEILHEAERAGSQRDAPNQERARWLCRSAFSVLRSRMEALTTPRWCGYRDYIIMLVRLIDQIKKLSPALWDFRDNHQLSKVEDAQGILFADELAWLYNDLGLAYCAEGSMTDCFAAWEQGYEINRIIEGEEPLGQYVVQSQLHLAHTFLELGQLQDFESYLVETKKSNHSLDDQDYKGRISGYFGLLAHLGGNLQVADKHYKNAMRTVRLAGGNPRAESIFSRHRADLQLEMGNWEEAEKLIRVSYSVAEAGQHPDLVAFAAVTRGRLYRKNGAFERAREEYQTGLEYARKFGIRRLESDALAQLARLALDLHDYETARTKAVEALSIANQLGLGLRQTHTLVILGLATLKGGQRQTGLAYLRHAHDQAKKQQYFLRAREVQEVLQKEGEMLPSQWF